MLGVALYYCDGSAFPDLSDPPEGSSAALDAIDQLNWIDGDGDGDDGDTGKTICYYTEAGLWLKLRE